jgi:GxxExxY protein
LALEDIYTTENTESTEKLDRIFPNLCVLCALNNPTLKRETANVDTEKPNRDALTEKIIGCAIEVHRNLGPGLLESTYEQCLARELSLNQFQFRLQTPIPVQYKGIHLDCGYRIDVWVEGQVILELKSVDKISAIHEAQLLTYMKLATVSKGLLINFNVKRLADGIRRFRI